MSQLEQPDEEIARLVLMELRDKGQRSLILFGRRWQAEQPNARITAEVARSTWRKYMGFDNRVFPTHDIDSGERIK